MNKPQTTEINMTNLSAEMIDEFFEVKIITPENACFKKTPGGFMTLVFSGKEYGRVACYRAFPFSEPYRYISIRQTNPKAEEIGMILDLEEWPQDTRELIMSQLAIRYFVPMIEKIKSIKEEYGFAYWYILTDRGEMHITTSIWSPVTKITPTRLLVTDLDGNRYEIANFDHLSPKEKKMIDLFL